MARVIPLDRMGFIGPLAFGYDPQDAPDWKEEDMLYEIVWTETAVCTAYVDADTEGAARQCWIDDHLASDVVRVVDTSHLNEINVMPARHDELCCCPTCEGT